MEGFPRPRGDGPYRASRPCQRDQVSPPTRGWTAGGSRRQGARTGFPAHAGMDPVPIARLFASTGFPRPRGDGPDLGLPDVRIDEVSPPTRGWTPSGRAWQLLCPGFPAHAGMDRGMACGRAGGARFPRPRGDGPPAASCERARSQVSPPTRGWTMSGFFPEQQVSGFPAHAGMDPGNPGGRPGRPGFPRPRGDGPPLLFGQDQPGQVSPPTRGWTPRVPNPARNPFGFPAHAGMDPEYRACGCSARRFPRPRGDGPLRVHQSQEVAAVSPPTRGWTLTPQADVRGVDGFPAHAGMDPPMPLPVAARPGFPRPRGDGPTWAAWWRA